MFASHLDSIQPAWSPDGRFIVFTHDISGDADYQIFVVSVLGHRLRRLTREDTGTDLGRWVSDMAPRWSGDDRSIAFIQGSGDNCQGCGGPSDLFIVNAITGKERRLTSNGQVINYTWSPDGTKIAYVRESGNLSTITILNAATGRTVRTIPVATTRLTPVDALVWLDKL